MTTTAPDGELVERCVQGDRAAWGELCARYRCFLAKVLVESREWHARRGERVGCEIADLLQETWADLPEALVRFDFGREPSLASFLAKVAKNRVRRATELSATGGAHEKLRQPMAPGIERRAAAVADSPEQEAGTRERARIAAAVLAKMPPYLSRVLVAVELERQPIDQIAVRFKIGRGSVIVYTKLARRAFAAAFESASGPV